MLSANLRLLPKRENYRVLRRLMSSHGGGGIAGSNLPCPKCIGNPTRCAVAFALFFGVGMWVPCIAFIYLMHKD